MNGLVNYPSDGIAPLQKSASSAVLSAQVKNLRKKIGILGLGSIGSRHLKNFKDLGCEVLGYDSKDYSSEDQRQSLIEWADAIVIATPTGQHYIDIMSISIGKDLFVEKPLVDNTSLPTTVYTNNIKMVGYNLRFHSCVKQARKWLAKGAIGKPLWARFTCAQFNNKPDYHRDGVLLNWSHELDLAVCLLGDATLGAASARHAGEAEDLADLTLIHTNNGCHSNIHLDYLTHWERRGFVIVGEYGSLEADLVTRQAHLRNNRGGITDTFYGRDSFDSNYVAEAEAFLARLDGEETLGATADEAMLVIQLCLEAKECAR